MKDKKLSDLFAEVKLWNAAYRMGRPMVSDREYDERIEALKNVDPGNEWFKALEPAPVKKERKRSLPIPMKSLDKVKSMQELKGWLKAVATVDFKVVVMPKFDGLSLLYNEKTGEAYSRGGAENEGQDCSRHCALLSNAHNKSENDYNFTFGEFVFSRRNWESYFAGRKMDWMEEAYKSPRNTAAGLLNRDNPSAEIGLVDFYRYGIDEDTLFRFYNRFEDALADICDDFGQKHLYKVCDKAQLTEAMLEGLYREWSTEYYIDGLVIYANNLNSWQRVGRAANGNPRYAIAYKHPNFTDNFETTVVDINWKVSKAGALKPTVQIDAVNTGDCIMENPTGNNFRWLAERKISPGAKLLVTRSGGVIPKILSCIKPANDFSQDKIAPPHCPSCHSYIKPEGVDLICTNPECPGKKLAEIMHFVTTCDMEGIGEDTIAKLFNAGYTTLRHFFNSDIEWMQRIEGIGATISEMVHFEFLRVKKADLPIAILMHASNCFAGIGRVKAEKEFEAMPPDEVKWFTEGTWDLHQPDVDTPEYDRLPITRQSLIKGYRKFFKFLDENELKFSVPRIFQKTSGAYENFNVCFSGIRDLELEQKIKMGGGHVSVGVTKKTTHLFVRDVNQDTSKIRTARALGVEILTIPEFCEKY